MYLFFTPNATYVPETSAPDTCDAATRFDCYCDWLQATLERDTYHPSRPGLPQAVALIDPELSDLSPSPGDASDGREACADTLPCHVCGRETRLVLLCHDCLERISELPETDACPWWLHTGWCAARVELFDGEQVQVACGGRLTRCEQRRCLDEVL